MSLITSVTEMNAAEVAAAADGLLKFVEVLLVDAIRSDPCKQRAVCAAIKEAGTTSAAMANGVMFVLGRMAATIATAYEGPPPEPPEDERASALKLIDELHDRLMAQRRR
ncbi:hypothetical protein COU19_00260 [Candidatus Kaiserbacteria bacterium CG10_big_fil_rev_8_21_14_0_10_56_12]|uniref:Uncharacterized protein n=1 Tax=Candidatus Kaiserbacteria bacterium CG10_big_fil_rev_8_21_14_0_10_56_12 TaxID=1974611 RepID=A0A2H0UAU9_9BACT|nr:MAG: hypothetical protein COU19_00260 [Candidatus Kaiserbacteria bacterium CG10_big_fil_rev_8_21_14_0_10_56_12]